MDKGVPILDVGCGTGIPVLSYLASKKFDVYGVDISDIMLAQAKVNVPTANLYKQNMLNLDFPDNYFQGLICLHSIIHIPRTKHEFALKNFNRVLKPNGSLLICTGSEPYEDTHPFLDVPLFFSYPSPSDSLELMERTNFTIIYDKIINMNGEEFYWILAQKRNFS